MNLTPLERLYAERNALQAHIAAWKAGKERLRQARRK